MSNGKKTARRPPKPLLAAAVFCDRVLEHSDGTVSAIRLVDTVNARPLPGNDPEKRAEVWLWALVAFKSGEAEGDRTLRLVLRLPTGKRRLVQERVISFKGGEAGFNLRLRVHLKIKTPGLYWTDVILDRTRLTSMPLRINFEKAWPDPTADLGGG